MSSFLLSSCFKNNPFEFTENYLEYVNKNVIKEYTDVDNNKFTSLNENYIPSKGLYTYIVSRDSGGYSVTFNFNFDEGFFCYKNEGDVFRGLRYQYFDYLNGIIKSFYADGYCSIKSIDISKMKQLYSASRLFSNYADFSYRIFDFLTKSPSGLILGDFASINEDERLKSEFTITHPHKKDLNIRRTYTLTDDYPYGSNEKINTTLTLEAHYVNYLIDYSLELREYEGIVDKREFKKEEYNDSLKQEILGLNPTNVTFLNQYLRIE